MQQTATTSCKVIKTEENAVNEPESEVREEKALSESETSKSPQDNLDGTKGKLFYYLNFFLLT